MSENNEFFICIQQSINFLPQFYLKYLKIFLWIICLIENINYCKNPLLMSLDDHQINEYQLTILSVKMKVKFPCKMKLEHCSNSITDQVQSGEHSKFTFNQQITIQEQAEKSSFDFNIVLITEKGAKYVSGVIKLHHSELQRSQGQKIICPLIKCLDNQATCQIKINKVKSGKVPKRISVSSTLIQLKKQTSNNHLSGHQQKLMVSPKAKKSSGVQTRSELGFGGLNGRTINDWQDTRSKGAAQTLIYKSNFLKSPKTKKTYAMCSPKSKLGPDYNHQYQILSQRQKLSSQSEVYKQGYQKLKQKYKKQSQSLKSQQTKRMQLQANQNNFKIQIMRLKLKSQEQQRIITQKNQKINQLQVFISEINKQELDMSYLKQQNKNLSEKISMMNNAINSLKKENEVIKKLNQDRSKSDKTIIQELRQQIQQAKSKLQSFTLESSENLRHKTQQILSLSSQVKSRTSTIQLQKSQIHKLQTHVQNKIYEFEKTLQQQKNQSIKISNQLKQKLEILERQKKSIEKQLSDSKSQKQKIKTLILKAQYDKKVLLQQQKVIKNQLLELKQLKQKYSELSREITFLNQDKINLTKQLQSVSQSKQINLQQINEHYELKLNYHKKLAKDSEQKYKTLASTKIQLQSQIQLAKNSIDKQKRQIQAYGIEIQQLKHSLKQQKQYSNVLQQQNLNLQNQVSLTLNKLRFGEQAMKLDAEKYRTQLERTKNQLAAQNSKAVQLFESKSNLQIQLNKNRIQIQYHQQKIDKLFTSNKEYQSNIEYLMKQHQAQINDNQQTILKNQAQIRSCNQLIYKSELQRIQFLQKIQNFKKQQKLTEQKIAYLESQLKARNQDIAALQQKNKNNQKIHQTLEVEHSTLKHEYSVMKNDKNKLQKILEIKKEEVQELKTDKLKLENEKASLETIEHELREQIKRLNQMYTKLEMRLKSSDKEFNKFKQLMHRTIKNQYAKLPLIGSTALMTLLDTHGGQEQVLRSSRNNQQSKITVNLVNSENRQNTQKILVHTLNTASILTGLTSSITQSKTTLFKLIQHNKQLKKQVQNLKQQSQQSSNKYQFTEIQLHQNIQHLEEQLNQVYDQKEQQLLNYDKVISQLNAKIHDKQNQCEELQLQIQELQYALSSLKLDFQTNNEKNDKKVIILKQTINELQGKVDFFKVSLSNQQDTNHQLQQKLQNVKNQKDNLLQLSLKNRLTIQELIRQKQILQQTSSETLKDRKSLLQKVNQLEIQLNEQTNLKLQNKQLLQEEQKRTIDLKEFNAVLMKQKQNIIKSQLEKNDRILQLQAQEIQLKRDLQISAQDLQRIKSELEETKQKYRRQTATTKNLENQLNQSVSKSKKISQKLEQKQKQIQMKDEIIGRLDKKYKQLAQKNYKQTLQLHTQIDSKYSENINISKQLNQKILFLQAKIEQLQHIKAKQHHEYVLISDQLLAQKEHSQLIKRQIAKIQAQLEQMTDEYKSLQKRYEQLNQEIQTRDEQLSCLNDRIIVLEGELQALNKDKVLKLEELDSDWRRKYQSLIQENEQKFSMVQNDRQMLRQQLEEKINELEVSLNQNKNSQLGITDIKKNYDEKLKKIENDRLNTILNKNNDIKKLTEQNTLLTDKLKALENGQRQNSELLQNLRKRLIAEQKLRKQSEEKLKSQKKVHEIELTNLLTKQHKSKVQKQGIYQSIWSNQREVRKIVQNYLKKILDQCDNGHIDKITNASKGLQTEIVKAMTSKLSSALHQ